MQINLPLLNKNASLGLFFVFIGFFHLALHPPHILIAQSVAQDTMGQEQANSKIEMVLQKLILENQRAEDQRLDIVKRIDETKRNYSDLTLKRDKLRKRAADITNLVSGKALSQIMGESLWRMLRDLPSASEMRREIASLDSNSIAVESERLGYLQRLEEILEEIKDPAISSAQYLSDTPLSPEEFAGFEKTLIRQLNKNKKTIAALVTTYDEYISLLSEGSQAIRINLTELEEFSRFLRERVLFVKSASPVRNADLVLAYEALQWIILPENWRTALKFIVFDVKNASALWVLFAIFLLAFSYYYRRIKSFFSEEQGNFFRSNPRIKVMFGAIISCIVLSLVAPLAIAFIGWRLHSPLDQTEFARALGAALISVASIVITINFFRVACSKNGLAVSYLNWSRDMARLFRNNFGLLLTAVFPLKLISEILNAKDQINWINSLGRFCFLLAVLVVIIVFRRIFNPNSGVIAYAYSKKQDGQLFYSFRYLWFTLAIIVPVIIFILSVIGYHYTADALLRNLFYSLLFVTVLMLIRSFLFRIVELRQRQIIQKQISERKSERDSGDASITEPTVNLFVARGQLLNLISLAILAVGVFGLWLIWKSQLPALGAIKMDLPAGVSAPITLSDIILAILIIVFTVIAVKNIAGALEFSVLRYLRLDHGARFATISLSQYVIVIIGLSIASKSLGLQWTSIQWLVAALGVGIGFGLQEIFANFISGIVLLFERPIRIGDIVTMGDVTGKISKIRMRATTIMDWEMRELVIPNKEFVTGRLINWTLTDTVSRMSINVGVAYGTDPEKVRGILLRIADEHPLVLKEPPPHALFDSFGDSALNFILRVYMPSRDVFLQLRHEINTAIFKAFAEEGIQIPFPQRDVHIINGPVKR